MTAQPPGRFGIGSRRARHRATDGSRPGLASPTGKSHLAPSHLHRWLAAVAAAAVTVAGLAGWWLLANRGSAPVTGPDTVAADGFPAAVRGVVEIGRSGSLAVDERIVFPSPRNELTLTVADHAGTTAQFHPTVSDLSVVADGQRQAAGKALKAAASATIHLAGPAAEVALHYSAAGTVSRSRPSAPGRALVLVTPVSVERADRLSSRLEIVSSGVLNVGCVHANGEMTTCARRTDTGWVVQGKGAAAATDVVAQVDLGRLGRR